MGTANLDLVPENLEKVCLETREKERWITNRLHKTHEFCLVSQEETVFLSHPFSGVNSLASFQGGDSRGLVFENPTLRLKSCFFLRYVLLEELPMPMTDPWDWYIYLI